MKSEISLPVTHKPSGAERRTPRARAWGEVLLPYVVFAALLGIWELLCDTGKIPQYLLPSPSQIAEATWAWRGVLAGHLWVTCYEVVLGFLLAVAVGIPLAVLIVYSNLARRVTMPLLLIFQSVPKVALAPLILLWIGYGASSKVLIAMITAFFPIIINTSTGMASVEPELLELTRSLNAPTLKVFWKVRLPWSMPYVFSAMKVAMTLSVIGAVVAEFVGSDRGLGYFILTMSTNVRTALVFAAIALLSILGNSLFALVSAAERYFCPWTEHI
ncbi:MAG: ABC transporter permease [Vulcanimicrobiaceae bacterium]